MAEGADKMYDNSAEEKWLMDKWGCFSASVMSKLLSKGQGEMFGKGAKTYIKSVAREAYTLFNTEENVQTFDMKMGKVREAQSVYYWEEQIGLRRTGYQMIYHGGDNPHFEKFDADSGVSADVVVRTPENKVVFGAELKNPKGDTHMDYLFEIHDAADLQNSCLDYYTQCQFAMMTYDCDLWHWCSHNEFFPPKDRLLIIEVEKDKPFCDSLLVRLKMAEKIKRKIIEMRMNDYKGSIDSAFVS